MKPKTLILMLVAVGCGLGAAVATSQYVRKPQADEAVQEEARFPVLLAQRDMRAFSNLKEAHVLFKEELRPKNEIPKGAVTDFKLIEGRSLRNDLKLGDPLVETDLMTVDQAGITAMLNDGERAFSVKVTPLTGTAGFIRPGDRVDVVASQTSSARGEAFSKIILQDIEVLAIEAQLQAEENVVNKPVDNVTLRVTPVQVEMLAAYTDTNQGTLRLVPRRKGDIRIVNTAGASPGTSKEPQAGPGSESINLPTPPSGVTSLPPLLAPSVPNLPAAVVAEDPKTRKHMMTIINSVEKEDIHFFELPLDGKSSAKREP